MGFCKRRPKHKQNRLPAHIARVLCVDAGRAQNNVLSMVCVLHRVMCAGGVATTFSKALLQTQGPEHLEVVNVLVEPSLQ